MNFIIILAISYFSFSELEEYKSTEFSGKNKFQRLRDIETYLSKISTELDGYKTEEIKINIKSLNEKVEALEKKVSAISESFQPVEVKMAEFEQGASLADAKKIRDGLEKLDKFEIQFEAMKETMRKIQEEVFSVQTPKNNP